MKPIEGANLFVKPFEYASKLYDAHVKNSVQWAVAGCTRVVSPLSTELSDSNLYRIGTQLFKTLCNTGSIALPIFAFGVMGLVISTLPSYIFVSVTAAFAISGSKNMIKQADRATQVALALLTIAAICIVPKAALCSLALAILTEFAPKLDGEKPKPVEDVPAAVPITDQTEDPQVLFV